MRLTYYAVVHPPRHVGTLVDPSVANTAFPAFSGCFHVTAPAQMFDSFVFVTASAHPCVFCVAV